MPNHRETTEEILALMNAVDEFALQMKVKLLDKLVEDNFRGWDDPKNEKGILEDLKRHLDRGRHQYIDVANLAMMLHRFQRSRDRQESQQNSFDHFLVSHGCTRYDPVTYVCTDPSRIDLIEEEAASRGAGEDSL
jgi:hypothetical protein